MIPNIPAQLDLKKLRLDAKLKQADLARRLNVTQSQILRYEAEPENVPLRVAREWIEACGHLNAGHGLGLGTPYDWISSRLEELRGYERKQPLLEEADTVGSPVGVERFIEAIEQIGTKPRVVLSGRYDAGKSRLANTLLGADRLPTAYQPATRIICLIRHIADKPNWQIEDVWIMDDEFKLSDARDRRACESHRLIAGDLETLRRFGTHSGSKLAGRDPGSALIYLDSPILNACDLIDTPGIDHDETDGALARSALAYGDVVLYLSPLNGFMNGNDIQAISVLIKSLPAQANADRLSGFFVLATHAHSGVSDEDITSALNRGAERLCAVISPIFTDGDSGQRKPLDVESLRRRFFPWYVEIDERRKAFEAEFEDVLKNTLPTAMRVRLATAEAEFKVQASREFTHEIDRIQSLLADRENAAQQMQLIRESEPDRQHARRENEQRIKTLISQYKADTATFISEVVAPLFTEESLKQLIEKRYESSRDAEKEAGTAVITDATKLVEHFIDQKSADLAKEVTIFLKKYEIRIDGGLNSVVIPFDAKAAFLGGLAGGGTFGALAGWAAIVAGGSNLGAYLLVPQIVGLLSSLGISIAGGTATGVSTVAALGGPVGVGIGIAVAVGAIVWQALGRSWQARLARGLAETFAKMNIRGKIWLNCKVCWDETFDAFEKGARFAEEAHLKHLARLQAQLGVPEEVLRARLARIQARQAFLDLILNL